MSGCSKEKDEIKKLKDQIKQLRTKLSVYVGIQRSVNGTKGENLIFKLIEGCKTVHNAPHDLITKKGNRIEIKTAQCLPANYKNKTPCHRWAWRYVIRPNKKIKYYDYLILLGEKDKRLKHNDKDRTPFMYFFFSYEQAKKMIAPGDSYGQINMTTNFETVRSNQGLKLMEFRKSFKELQDLLTKL